MVAGVGGGTLSPASHPSSARLRGSWSRRRLNNVVPARNMPMTTIGASMRSAATSGCEATSRSPAAGSRARRRASRGRRPRRPSLSCASLAPATPSTRRDRRGSRRGRGRRVPWPRAPGRRARLDFESPVIGWRRRRRCGRSCGGCSWSSSAAATSAIADHAPDDRTDRSPTTRARSAACTSRPTSGERVEAEAAEVDGQVVVPEHHADDGEVAGRHLAQRATGEPRLGVVVEADRHVATLARDARPDRLGPLTADHVDDHLGPAAVGERHHPVEDVFGRVVDRHRAESADSSPFSGPPAIASTVRPRRDAELDHRGADRGGAADHEQRLAPPASCARRITAR